MEIDMSKKSKKTSWRGHVAVAALSFLAASQAQAAVIAAVPAADNWTHGVGQFLISGMVSPLFFNGAGQRFVVTYSAECAVSAPAGDTASWVDVDIQVLNEAGAVVSTLAPTVGSADAFCSANGTVGFDGWSTNSVTAVSPGNLPAGNFRVQVQSRTNSGATGGWHGERLLLIQR
jgi:hypothetical protein